MYIYSIFHSSIIIMCIITVTIHVTPITVIPITTSLVVPISYVLTRRSLFGPDGMPCVVLWGLEALDCKVLISPETWNGFTRSPIDIHQQFTIVNY